MPCAGRELRPDRQVALVQMQFGLALSPIVANSHGGRDVRDGHAGVGSPRQVGSMRSSGRRRPEVARRVADSGTERICCSTRSATSSEPGCHPRGSRRRAPRPPPRLRSAGACPEWRAGDSCTSFSRRFAGSRKAPPRRREQRHRQSPGADLGAPGRHGIELRPFAHGGQNMRHLGRRASTAPEPAGLRSSGQRCPRQLEIDGAHRSVTGRNEGIGQQRQQSPAMPSATEDRTAGSVAGENREIHQRG